MFQTSQSAPCVYFIMKEQPKKRLCALVGIWISKVRQKLDVIGCVLQAPYTFYLLRKWSFPRYKTIHHFHQSELNCQFQNL
jgi:hypothetical protein